MKQKYILAAAASVMLLNACGTSSKIKLVKPEEAANIRHVCIIKNPKVTRQADLDKLFAAALEKQGISSEILSPPPTQNPIPRSAWGWGRAGMPLQPALFPRCRQCRNHPQSRRDSAYARLCGQLFGLFVGR